MTLAFTLTRPPETETSCVWIGHHFLEGQSVLITHGTINDALDPKHWPSPTWQGIRHQPKHTSRTLRTDLYGPFKTQKEADATMYVLNTLQPPWCPMNEPGSTNEARPVVLREIGRIYPSVGAAARFESLDASALRKHLRRKPGFRSVKGKRFVFYDELSAEDQATVDRMNAALEAMEE